MAISNEFTLGTAVFTRIPSPSPLEGRFIDKATSVNTPSLVIVRPKVVRDGISQYVVQYSQAKDSLSTVPNAKDDVMTCQLSFRFDNRRFSLPEAQAAFSRISQFMSLADMWAEVLRGGA